MRKIDRSRLLTYHSCPRAYYWNYEHDGMGVVSPKLSIPLATGSTVHLGLEALLKGTSVDEAVGRALTAYDELADASRGIANNDPAQFDYTVAEQSALVEALVRIYALRGLLALLADYEVIEVEGEYEWSLTDIIHFMSRLDGVLRRRDDGTIWVLSFKTDSGANLDGKLAEARLDLQGLTEPLAIDGTGRWPSAMGVKMEWLVKGPWRSADGTGLKWQDTHLVRPWMRDGQFAWRYFTPCPGTPHATTRYRAGKPYTWMCDGGDGNHALGNTWERVPIWQIMPIKEWVDMLAAGGVQPDAGDPLAGALYLPPPIVRLPGDAICRRLQLAAEAEDIADRASATNLHSIVDIALNSYWPQHTDKCLHWFGGTCPYHDICWAVEGSNPLDGYVPRVPNHPTELIQLEANVL